MFFGRGFFRFPKRANHPWQHEACRKSHARAAVFLLVERGATGSFRHSALATGSSASQITRAKLWPIWQKKHGSCQMPWTRVFLTCSQKPVQNVRQSFYASAESASEKTRTPSSARLTLWQRKENFRALFLGAASGEDPYCHEFFELLKTRPWCGHTGFVICEKLKSHLREATLLALPSLEDNCPMAVLEAGAAGVPVVAANVGGVPDLIEDGKNGLLFDPQNAASMSGAVEKILAQPEFARALAAEANRRAKERFHPPVVARKHLEIYREVLNTRS